MIPIESLANNQSISTRNSWLSEMDYYRSAPKEYKCDSVDRLRSYAVSLMEQGDVSLASHYNSFLPRTGCRKSPIVIDQSAIKSTKNPKPSDIEMTSQLLDADGSCLSMTEILSIGRTGFISKRCGNTLMHIKTHPWLKRPRASNEHAKVLLKMICNWFFGKCDLLSHRWSRSR